ncbi:MAG: putative addiction module antidote protein [Treponema sp.]|nr:putative addiction module antidote protein [Treponema sp.]
MKQPSVWQRNTKMFKTTEWDPAKYINSKEDVLAYLEAALEENDTELLLSVIGDIARSKGMAQIARELNVARESLYRSLSPEGNPSFSTVMQVLDILGFQLSLKQKATA